MNTSKLHHFVPQFHVRRFANIDEKIWVWERERDRVFPTSPNSIAAETHFYRLLQYEALGHDGTTMEKQFSALETQVSIITGQWLEWLRAVEPFTEIPIPEENRNIVAQHMALQYLRTADTREILGILAHKEYGSAVSSDELRRLHTELLWDEQIVTDLTARFAEAVWIFARNGTTVPYVTSDNPIAFRTHNNRQWRRIGLQGGTYAVYPIASDIIMYCYPREEPWHDKLDDLNDCLSPVAISDEMVLSENSGQAFMATRFIFSNKNDFTWERQFAPTIGTDIFKPEE
ncbi:uncharacterized protein DUF4238 [Sinorhizobium medicae]|uniref:DUF4238 domain-containing protein n=1 Tax=Sinorhizobium medicae TaxID=110321 RepID=UPI0011A699D0|nr:DUF4238 domain-containing protein [Sinorhizobium medicae]TWA26390.1 uncharacterized protein DUF4238 [Sinorhizobium medicae]